MKRKRKWFITIMYSERSSVAMVCITCIALCTQIQGSVTVLIASSAVPNPPTVTVTPLYGCGYLLEIKSQATAGVGCNLMCAFHTTSLCHMAMCFYCLLLQKFVNIHLCMHTVKLLLHVIYSQCAYTQYGAKQSTCACMCAC